MTAEPLQPEPLFFYVVAAKKVRPGDVVHEINDRPLRGGPLMVGEVRHVSAESGKRIREGWELIPQPANSRMSRFIDPDARLKVARPASARRINPIVSAAAIPRRTPKRRKPADADQLALFEVPPRRK